MSLETILFILKEKSTPPPRFSVFLACPGAFRGVNLGAWLLKFWPQEAET